MSECAILEAMDADRRLSYVEQHEPLRIEKQRRRELEPQEHHAITCRLLGAMLSGQEPVPETVQEGQRRCADEGRGDVVNLKIVE